MWTQSACEPILTSSASSAPARTDHVRAGRASIVRDLDPSRPPARRRFQVFTLRTVFPHTSKVVVVLTQRHKNAAQVLKCCCANASMCSHDPSLGAPPLWVPIFLSAPHVLPIVYCLDGVVDSGLLPVPSWLRLMFWPDFLVSIHTDLAFDLHG